MGSARAFFGLSAFVVVALSGCAGEDAESSAPQSPSPANSAATVIENINYTTNVYGPATINTGGSSDAAAPVATNGETNVIVDSTPPATPSPDVVDTSVPDTGEPSGVAECDRYLARVSFCSHRMLSRVHSGDEASKRIDDSLASARRAWRSIIRSHPEVRGTLAQQCVDMRRMYESSIKDRCSD